MDHPVAQSTSPSASLSVSPSPAPDPARKTAARAALSRVFFSCAVLLVVWFAALYGCSFLLQALLPAALAHPAVPIALSSLTLLLVAMPACALVLRSMPHTLPTPKPPIGGARIALLFFICFGLMLSASLLSSLLLSLLSSLLSLPLNNSLQQLTEVSLPMLLLSTVLLAPLAEELLCRRLLLSRLLPYGEIPAVLVSSLLFACIHANLYQLLYAFLLGVVLSFLYLRTGRLRYCVILHALLNFFGSFVTPLISQFLTEECRQLVLGGAQPPSPQQAAAIVQENIVPLFALIQYLLLEYGAALAGILLTPLLLRRFRLLRQAEELSLKATASLSVTSPGCLLFLVVAAACTTLNMVG